MTVIREINSTGILENVKTKMKELKDELENYMEAVDNEKKLLCELDKENFDYNHLIEIVDLTEEEEQKWLERFKELRLFRRSLKLAMGITRVNTDTVSELYTGIKMLQIKTKEPECKFTMRSEKGLEFLSGLPVFEKRSVIEITKNAGDALKYDSKLDKLQKPFEEVAQMPTQQGPVKEESKEEPMEVKANEQAKEFTEEELQDKEEKFIGAVKETLTAPTGISETAKAKLVNSVMKGIEDTVDAKQITKRQNLWCVVDSENKILMKTSKLTKVLDYVAKTTGSVYVDSKYVKQVEVCKKEYIKRLMSQQQLLKTV